jgi:hypothetical protein
MKYLSQRKQRFIKYNFSLMHKTMKVKVKFALEQATRAQKGVEV